jgi:hypothetical protein
MMRKRSLSLRLVLLGLLVLKYECAILWGIVSYAFSSIAFDSSNWYGVWYRCTSWLLGLAFIGLAVLGLENFYQD